MSTNIQANLTLNTAQAQASFNSFAASIGSAKFAQPLGRISGDAAEFTKSLSAATARVTAFGLTAGAIYKVSQAIREGAKATIEVDKQLIELNTYIGKSRDELEGFSQSLFKVAKNSAVPFEAAAEAAKEFARQGISANEILKRTGSALTLARIAGISYTQAVTGITTAINSFNKEALSTEDIVNKLIAVDTRFAVSSAQLNEALSRVGSSAEESGISLDKLIATVTAAQQITGRGGAVIGNALKTIFTRLQRPEVLTQLEQLGVAVKDQGGYLLDGISILKNYADATKNLSQTEKARTAELVGGIYQINQVNALIKDLSSSNSVYADALRVSSAATDEAKKKNEELNKSMSALLQQTKTSAQEAASALGASLLGPLVKLASTASEALLQLVNPNSDLLGQGEDSGKKFANGILKGAASVLGKTLGSGGLPILAATGGLLAAKYLKFGVSSLKELGKASTEMFTSEKELQIQKRINDTLRQNPAIVESVRRGTMNLADAEAEVLRLIQQQNISLLTQSRITGRVTSTVTSAQKASKKGFRIFAEGYMPDTGVAEAAARLEENTARKMGAVNPKARVIQATIKGKTGPIIVNDQETVIPNYANGETAVIPNYRKLDEIPRMAKGYVPNFAREKITAAAYKTKKGNIFTGSYHAEAYEKIPQDENNDILDGFVTNSGKFVDRKEAGLIAQAAMQMYDNANTKKYFRSNNYKLDTAFLPMPRDSSFSSGYVPNFAKQRLGGGFFGEFFGLRGSLGRKDFFDPKSNRTKSNVANEYVAAQELGQMIGAGQLNPIFKTPEIYGSLEKSIQKSSIYKKVIAGKTGKDLALDLDPYTGERQGFDKFYNLIAGRAQMQIDMGGRMKADDLVGKYDNLMFNEKSETILSKVLRRNYGKLIKSIESKDFEEGEAQMDRILTSIAKKGGEINIVDTGVFGLNSDLAKKRTKGLSRLGYKDEFAYGPTFLSKGYIPNFAQIKDYPTDRQILSRFRKGIDKGKYFSDFYDRYEKSNPLAGPDRELLNKIYASQSYGTDDSLVFETAIKIFKGVKSGETNFDSLLKPLGLSSGRKKILDKILSGKELETEKTGQYFKALSGDKNALAIDRNVINTALGRTLQKGESTSPEFRERLRKIIRKEAARSKMDPRAIQAALFAGRSPKQASFESFEKGFSGIKSEGYIPNFANPRIVGQGSNLFVSSLYDTLSGEHGGGPEYPFARPGMGAAFLNKEKTNDMIKLIKPFVESGSRVIFGAQAGRMGGDLGLIQGLAGNKMVVEALKASYPKLTSKFIQEGTSTADLTSLFNKFYKTLGPDKMREIVSPFIEPDILKFYQKNKNFGSSISRLAEFGSESLTQASSSEHSIYPAAIRGKALSRIEPVNAQKLFQTAGGLSDEETKKLFGTVRVAKLPIGFRFEKGDAASKLLGLSQGYIPNFSGLSKAVSREKTMSGLPASQIMAHFDGGGNPVAVTNKRDEPNGLKDVPNFAIPSRQLVSFLSKLGLTKGRNNLANPISAGAELFGGTFATSILDKLAEEELISSQVSTAANVAVPSAYGLKNIGKGIFGKGSKLQKGVAIASGATQLGVGVASALQGGSDLNNRINTKKYEEALDRSRKTFQNLTENTLELSNTLSKLDDAYRDPKADPKQILKLASNMEDLLSKVKTSNPGLVSKLASESSLAGKQAILEENTKESQRVQSLKEQALKFSSKGPILGKDAPKEIDSFFRSVINSGNQDLLKQDLSKAGPANFSEVLSKGGLNVQELSNVFKTDDLKKSFLDAIKLTQKLNEITSSQERAIIDVSKPLTRKKQETEDSRAVRASISKALEDQLPELASFAGGFSKRAGISAASDASLAIQTTQSSVSFQNSLLAQLSDKEFTKGLPSEVQAKLNAIETPSAATGRDLESIKQLPGLSKAQVAGIEKLIGFNAQQTREIQKAGTIANETKNIQLKFLALQEKLAFGGDIKTSINPQMRAESMSAGLRGPLTYQLGTLFGSRRTQLGGTTDFLTETMQKYPGLLQTKGGKEPGDVSAVKRELTGLNAMDMQRDLLKRAGMAQMMGLGQTSGLLRNKAFDSKYLFESAGLKADALFGSPEVPGEVKSSMQNYERFGVQSAKQAKADDAALKQVEDLLVPIKQQITDAATTQGAALVSGFEASLKSTFGDKGIVTDVVKLYGAAVRNETSEAGPAQAGDGPPVKNFANPVNDAVTREKIALAKRGIMGVPNFAMAGINLERSPNLVTASNPQGFGVTNSIDEKNGLRSLGMRSSGFVPNYAAFGDKISAKAKKQAGLGKLYVWDNIDDGFRKVMPSGNVDPGLIAEKDLPKGSKTISTKLNYSSKNSIIPFKDPKITKLDELKLPGLARSSPIDTVMATLNKDGKLTPKNLLNEINKISKGKDAVVKTAFGKSNLRSLGVYGLEGQLSTSDTKSIIGKYKRGTGSGFFVQEKVPTYYDELRVHVGVDDKGRVKIIKGGTILKATGLDPSAGDSIKAYMDAGMTKKEATRMTKSFRKAAEVSAFKAVREAVKAKGIKNSFFGVDVGATSLEAAIEAGVKSKEFDSGGRGRVGTVVFELNPSDKGGSSGNVGRGILGKLIKNIFGTKSATPGLFGENAARAIDATGNTVTPGQGLPALTPRFRNGIGSSSSALPSGFAPKGSAASASAARTSFGSMAFGSNGGLPPSSGGTGGGAPPLSRGYFGSMAFGSNGGNPPGGSAASPAGSSTILNKLKGAGKFGLKGLGVAGSVGFGIAQGLESYSSAKEGKYGQATLSGLSSAASFAGLFKGAGKVAGSAGVVLGGLGDFETKDLTLAREWKDIFGRKGEGESIGLGDVFGTALGGLSSPQAMVGLLGYRAGNIIENKLGLGDKLGNFTSGVFSGGKSLARLQESGRSVRGMASKEAYDSDQIKTRKMELVKEVNKYNRAAGNPEISFEDNVAKAKNAQEKKDKRDTDALIENIGKESQATRSGITSRAAGIGAAETARLNQESATQEEARSSKLRKSFLESFDKNAEANGYTTTRDKANYLLGQEGQNGLGSFKPTDFKDQEFAKSFDIYKTAKEAEAAREANRVIPKSAIEFRDRPMPSFPQDVLEEATRTGRSAERVIQDRAEANTRAGATSQGMSMPEVNTQMSRDYTADTGLPSFPKDVLEEAMRRRVTAEQVMQERAGGKVPNFAAMSNNMMSSGDVYSRMRSSAPRNFAPSYAQGSVPNFAAGDFTNAVTEALKTGITSAFPGGGGSSSNVSNSNVINIDGRSSIQNAPDEAMQGIISILFDKIPELKKLGPAALNFKK